jgi:hypothetical protein
VTEWTAIAEGDDISLSPGDRVAVVASVKASHSLADLGEFAAARGITLDDIAEEGSRPGLGPDPRAPDYRYVAAEGLASQAVSLPWSAPWPLSMVDGSELVAAWTAPPGLAAPPPQPPSPAPPSGPALPSMVPLVWIGAVALALAYRARDQFSRRPILARARR